MFRPVDEVALPENTRVEFEPRVLEVQQADAMLKAFEILSHSYETGQPDLGRCLPDAHQDHPVLPNERDDLVLGRDVQRALEDLEGRPGDRSIVSLAGKTLGHRSEIDYASDAARFARSKSSRRFGWRR